jgi:hypothetical protein
VLPFHRGANSIACNILPASSYFSIFYRDFRHADSCNSSKIIDLRGRSGLFLIKIEPPKESRAGNRKSETGSQKPEAEAGARSQKPEAGSRKAEAEAGARSQKPEAGKRKPRARSPTLIRPRAAPSAFPRDKSPIPPSSLPRSPPQS